VHRDASHVLTYELDLADVYSDPDLDAMPLGTSLQRSRTVQSSSRIFEPREHAEFRGRAVRELDPEPPRDDEADMPCLAPSPPITGRMCVDQRQPGSFTIFPTVRSPRPTTWTLTPGMSMTSSGSAKFFRWNSAIAS
jgi:hypothetical protein